MANEIDNPDTQPVQTYYNYGIPLPPSTTINNISGDTTTIVNTINGDSGSGATGPTVTISGGAVGLTFVGSSSTLTLSGTLNAAHGGTGQSSYTKGDLLAASAATTLSKLAAAANDARLTTDSTQTTGLIWVAASTGWTAWTGTADRTTHATYPTTTASVGYVQAELQGVMDSLKQVTEALKALTDNLLTQKIIKA